MALPRSRAVRAPSNNARPGLRIANWLHLNRGKKAWTYFADAYAAGLLLLAISGLFMIPGRKGIIGRGAVFLIVGIAAFHYFYMKGLYSDTTLPLLAAKGMAPPAGVGA